MAFFIKPKELQVPGNIILIFLPPYSPELTRQNRPAIHQIIGPANPLKYCNALQ
ncbi:hypothetical protein ACFSPU_08880 [Haoranjiania flava]|uniref:Tc1-like transposase DDE domain-containing protein n=1 Tax=Haoranjiania flava TaxID=1856322 RepID=A0AAE3LJ36_9BACT|nr:hypothetical protein [Haoranjiania flava]MCU7693208.1 hypothetical protein [Haoranjiania flava]